MTSTKIEFNCHKITRIQGLDELAMLLLPSNRNHQRIFLAIFIELKYSPTGFLTSLTDLCCKYEFSPRMLETVRSKMRRMGIIDHVSRFNKRYGYREGWIISSRFQRGLKRLAEIFQDAGSHKENLQEQKDRDLFRYL
ncbi:hypothetical protein [Desulfosarcina variabilis]|uniref:hypothetical protein n=1 Tax=Desulfosarcina variabilis TaxID=2300 RepID=UPI003AFB3DF2